MVKTKEQFAEDCSHGNSWELALGEELRRYAPSLSPFRGAIYGAGNKVVGGFALDPDFQALAKVEVVAKDEKWWATDSKSVEAKIRLADQFMFTCADDYPYDTIIVNEVYKTRPEHMTADEYLALNQFDQLVYMHWFHSYWIGSADKKHVALILPCTKPLWKQEWMWSPKDRRKALNWLCPIRSGGRDRVLFGRFPEDVPKLLTYC